MNILRTIFNSKGRSLANDSQKGIFVTLSDLTNKNTKDAQLNLNFR